MPLNSPYGSISITASLATTAKIESGAHITGWFEVVSGSAAVTLTWYGSADGTNFVAAYDDDNAAMTTTVAANRGYRIPLELAGARAIKIVGNDTATLRFSLKG